MITKEDHGDIKVEILRNPIPLNSLKYEDEATQNMEKKMNAAETNRDSKVLQKYKTQNTEMKTIAYLKEPISLDKLDFKGLSSLTLNVKTEEKPVKKLCSKKRQRFNKLWMENAVTIFKCSYVYPFIYINNKFKCFVCLEAFLDANILKEHTKNHRFKEIRQKIYNTANNTFIKVDVTHMQCRICDKSFHSLLELKNHLETHGKHIDSDAQDNLIPFRLDCEPFQCQVCGEENRKLKPLIIHMSKHFNNFSCDVCGSVFLTLKSLRRHLHTHEIGTFPCEKCDKVFSNSTKKQLHIRGVHLKEFPRRCPVCPERFNSDYMRTKHLRVAHNRTVGSNRCVTCGKDFELKYQLQLHVRSVHNQEKNQECPVCHSRFFSKYLLTRHMLTHTGIRNFKCDVCGKVFARKAHLKQHCRSHQNE